MGLFLSCAEGDAEARSPNQWGRRSCTRQKRKGQGRHRTETVKLRKVFLDSCIYRAFGRSYDGDGGSHASSRPSGPSKFTFSFCRPWIDNKGFLNHNFSLFFLVDVLGLESLGPSAEKKKIINSMCPNF